MIKRHLVALFTGLAVTAALAGVADAQYGGGEPPTTTTTSTTTVSSPTSTTVPSTTSTTSGTTSTTSATTSTSGTTPTTQATTTTTTGVEVGGVTLTLPPTTGPAGQTVPSNPVRGGEQARPQSQVLGVTNTRGNLVRTGQEAAPYVLTGVLLMGAGAIFVAASRKRRDAGTPLPIPVLD